MISTITSSIGVYTLSTKSSFNSSLTESKCVDINDSSLEKAIGYTLVVMISVYESTLSL